MDRAELERLDRDALIAYAEAAGVARAKILTRPELIDEIILRSSPDDRTRQRARGFFGRARDLLTKVIEKGLHLPDPVARVGGASFAWSPPVPPLPTVTLAGIYAAQGHREKAISTLREVLESEPDHDEAKSLLSQLGRPSYIPPPPPVFDQEEARAEAAGDEPQVDDAALPVVPVLPHEEAPAVAAPPVTLSTIPPPAETQFGESSICAIPAALSTLFVCWSVDEPTLLALRREAPRGGVTVRVVTIRPTWEGPETTVRDIPTGIPEGERLLTGIDDGHIVRVALGFRDERGFRVISHSPALELPRGEAGEAGLLRWTPGGMTALSDADADSGQIAAAVARARARARLAADGPSP